MQIQLPKVIVTASGGLNGSMVFERSDIVGAATATRMPDDKPPNVHTQWRLAVSIPLTEAEYKALVPTGLEPPYGT